MQRQSEKKTIKWLFDELPDLVDQQVITDQVANALQEHYRPKLLSEEQTDTATRLMSSYVGSLLTTFAALLVGGGMILILAHNWQELSREMRTVIAILPALFGLIFAAWILIRKKSRAWREFAGIWLMITVYSSLGIIAQTYHLGGKFATFMMIATMTTLFVPLILRSLGANLIQLIGFIAWGIAIWSPLKDNLDLANTLTLIAGLVLGPLLYYLSTLAQKSRWERMFDAITIVITTYFITPTLLNQFVKEEFILCLLLLTVASTLLLIGRSIMRDNANRISFPWQIGGWLGIGILSFILSAAPIYGLELGNVLSEWTLPIFAMALYSIYCISRYRLFEGIVGLLPLMVFCAILLICVMFQDGYAFDNSKVPSDDARSLRLFITGAFVLFSILGSIIGFFKKDFGILNGSMAILPLAIMIRFFDGDYSTARGVVFVTSSGIIILIVNLLANLFPWKNLGPKTIHT